MAKTINTNSLLRKVKTIADVLSNDGIGFSDYITQFTYLLFLKMDDERIRIGEKSSLPEDCQWKYLLGKIGNDLKDAYEHILKKLSLSTGLIGTIYIKAKNAISKPANLQKVIELINEEDWFSLDVDIKGAVYEEILEENGQDKKSGAGQYFTPRAVIRAMVEVTKPNLIKRERILDPACGTGGFLLAAFDYMKNQSKDKGLQNFLRTEALCGFDNTALVVSLASMNLYLHGVNENTIPISERDSLEREPDDLVDVILANPPFGDRPAAATAIERDDFYAKTNNNQLNFLQHIMLSLKIGGRAAVVLPDGVLENGGVGATIRRKLLTDFNLHTILRLPTGIFYAQGVKANVLFFTRGEKTKDLWVYDYRTNIHHTPKQKPLTYEHLKPFVEAYPNRSKELPRWKKFSAAELLKDPNVGLKPKWVESEEETPDDYTLQEVLDELLEEKDRISNAVKNLVKLLKDVE